jgi:hypothetical protein
VSNSLPSNFNTNSSNSSSSSGSSQQAATPSYDTPLHCKPSTDLAMDHDQSCACPSPSRKQGEHKKRILTCTTPVRLRIRAKQHISNCGLQSCCALAWSSEIQSGICR